MAFVGAEKFSEFYMTLHYITTDEDALFKWLVTLHHWCFAFLNNNNSFLIYDRPTRKDLSLASTRILAHTLVQDILAVNITFSSMRKHLPTGRSITLNLMAAILILNNMMTASVLLISFIVCKICTNFFQLPHFITRNDKFHQTCLLRENDYITKNGWRWFFDELLY